MIFIIIMFLKYNEILNYFWIIKEGFNIIYVLRIKIFIVRVFYFLITVIREKLFYVEFCINE